MTVCGIRRMLLHSLVCKDKLSILGLAYCRFLWYDESCMILGGVEMGSLRIVLTIIYILICVALVVLVLMQEGKTAGLGAVSGAAETYWGKNKGRSMEGKLVKITTGLAVGFMVLAVVLNLTLF